MNVTLIDYCLRSYKGWITSHVVKLIYYIHSVHSYIIRKGGKICETKLSFITFAKRPVLEDPSDVTRNVEILWSVQGVKSRNLNELHQRCSSLW